MWRLLNKLFGWDYIYWENSAGQGIARVYTGVDEGVWYWRYKSTTLIDIIESPNQVMWLTCKPIKYFGEPQ